MYNQDDLQPVNRNYIIVGIIFLIIFSTGVFGILFKSNNQNQKNITTTQPSTNSKENNGKDLSKYDEDSDGDKIPNFLEENLGTNTYSSETIDCEKANTSCQESPLKSTHNINIILDASTSMNILGKKNEKINEIREGVKKALNSDLANPYYKTAVYSFGNRGSINNIPDSESCISVLRHKSLATPLSDPKIDNPEFLNSFIPNGKSPVSFSLDQISKTLNKNEKNLIIVIVDSLDDCNGDIKRVVTEIRKNNLAGKINLATYFANEDANIYLKEVIESNEGYFSQNPDIEEFIKFSAKNFIQESWCKNESINKIKNCLDKKYKSANSYLNDQKNNRNISEEERVKITNTQSIMSYFLQTNIRRYQSSLEEEFNNYFK